MLHERHYLAEHRWMETRLFSLSRSFVVHVIHKRPLSDHSRVTTQPLCLWIMGKKKKKKKTNTNINLRQEKTRFFLEQSDRPPFSETKPTFIARRNQKRLRRAAAHWVFLASSACPHCIKLIWQWHRWMCTGLHHRNWFSAAEWRQIDKSGNKALVMS